MEPPPRNRPVAVSYDGNKGFEVSLHTDRLEHITRTTQPAATKTRPLQSAKHGSQKESNQMSWSDYGGYAYRDGIRVDERSDYPIPGSDPDNALEREPWGHAVLGSGRTFVALWKQTTVRAWHNGAELALVPYVLDASPGLVWTDEARGADLDPIGAIDRTEDETARATFALPGGAKLEAVWSREEEERSYRENVYLYARLELASGETWHGWSGYGVGAGYDEDAPFGYSNGQRDERLRDLWPDDFPDP